MNTNNSNIKKPKPIYLTPKKYTSNIQREYNESLNSPLNSAGNPENAAEPESEIESCVPSLNNKGKLTNFLLCLVLGLTIQIVSFFGSEEHFAIWYLMGCLLLLSGLLFYARISEQLKYMGERKRRELTLCLLGASGGVVFLRLVVSSLFLALILYGAFLVFYLLYARTYVVELNKWMSKYFKFIGFFD